MCQYNLSKHYVGYNYQYGVYYIKPGFRHKILNIISPNLLMNLVLKLVTDPLCVR